MKKALNCFLAVTAIATAIIGSGGGGPLRGGAASIMNSPGYQRRLQESRQQGHTPMCSELRPIADTRAAASSPH